jgi:hypothetical protein
MLDRHIRTLRSASHGAPVAGERVRKKAMAHRGTSEAQASWSSILVPPPAIRTSQQTSRESQLGDVTPLMVMG